MPEDNQEPETIKSPEDKGSENEEEIDEAVKEASQADDKDLPVKKDKGEDPQKRIDELTDTLKRLQAEFENYKKRCDRDMDAFRSYATESLLKELLPIMDSFEMAMKSKDKEKDFVKGVELIFAQLSSLLKQHGVEPIDSLGKKFDPFMHDVLLKGWSDKDPDTVIEELQKGYIFKGRVLRHSKVKVSE